VIPAAFDYHRPASLAEATGLLVDLGEEAALLAGGHSLIPMMKLRMATPAHLIDLQDIADLNSIARDGDGVTIGAMVTQTRLIEDATLGAALALIREAALQIADPQVRNQGTIGGNLANGDPGNDMPGLMQCLDAEFELVGPDGTRRVAARDFYHGAYDTARAEDEILTRIHVPLPPAGHGAAYVKQKRKIGDYATAAAAVLIAGGIASVAMTNLADRPIWSAEAGAAVAAGDRAGAIAAMQAAIAPVADTRGPVEFKRHVAGVVLGRAIDTARARAA